MNNKMITFIIAALCSSFSLFAQQKDDLIFIENVGQIHDQKGNARKDIDYVLHSNDGLNIFIGKGKISYQFANGQRIQRLEAQLKGANIGEPIISEEKQGYYENHYSGNKLIGVAHSYKKIVYRHVYPHIDWVMKINKDNSFEYEFAVGALGNATQIAIEYKGASNIQLDQEGNLIVQTPLGNIKEHAPETYTANGEKLKSEYALKGNTLRFLSDPYQGAIVIDPKVAWATYYGDTSIFATGATYFVDVKYNDKGAIYVSGATSDIKNIAIVGAYQTSLATTMSASKIGGFYIKMDTNGNRLYATYFNKAVNLFVNNDTVYLTGADLSDTLATAGAQQTSFAPYKSSAFLAKFDPSGSLMWCTYAGANSIYTVGAYCFVDKASNIYLFTGNDTYSPFVATPGAFKTTHSGGIIGFDAVIIKYNSHGQRIWGTYFGGGGDESINSAIYIENDLNGSLYMLGTTSSDTGIATPGAFRTSLSSMMDAMIVKFDTSGKRLWGTYVGGDSTDNAQAICHDGNKNIYISGLTTSKTGIATTGAYQTSHGGGLNDLFIMKFNTSGSREWGTYFGGEGDDVGYGLCNDSAGNIFFCAKTSSLTKIADTNAFQKTHSGGYYDGCVGALHPNGKKMWSSYYGGELGEDFRSIVSDKKNIYIAGNSMSKTKNIATKGSFLDTNANGNQKGFILKIRGAQESYYIDTVTSIKSVNRKAEMKLYPNPNNGSFDFETTINPNGKATLYVSDAMGKIVWKQTATAAANGQIKEQVYNSSLAAGVYFFHCKSGETDAVVEFVKE